MGTARFVRAEILSLREQEFVQAASAVGASGPRTIRRHLLPNALAPVLVSATLGIAGAILTESALSFLGFGVPPPDATWGNIIADGRKYIFDAPWLTVIPGTAIFVLVLAFNLFGEGLREAFNPKLRRAGSRGRAHRGARAGRQGPERRADAPHHTRCVRRSGGIGRRARLRGVWGNPWGFESPLRHHLSSRLASPRPSPFPASSGCGIMARVAPPSHR